MLIRGSDLERIEEITSCWSSHGSNEELTKGKGNVYWKKCRILTKIVDLREDFNLS